MNIRITVALLLAMAAPAMAQPQKLVESVEVRVTNVDVVVTDKSGKVVPGLTQNDFEILENGKPQTITNFAEIRAAAPPPAAPATQPSAPATTVAAPPVPAPLPPPNQRRRFVLFVDDYTLHPLRRNEVFRALGRFLDRQFRPGDEGTLIEWNRSLHVRVPFTSDRAVLQKGIDALADAGASGASLEQQRTMLATNVNFLMSTSSGPRGAGVSSAYENALSMVRAFADEQYHNERQMLTALRAQVGLLAGFDGRKVLVFAGTEIPQYPALEVFDWLRQKFMSSRGGQVLIPMSEAQQRRLDDSVTAIARGANSAGVTLYFIDTATMDEPGGSGNSMNESGLGNPFLRFTNGIALMQQLAEATGGTVVSNTNNFDAAFETVANDLSDYYSLGYHPTDTSNGEHRIEVRMKNAAYRARSRQAYTQKSSEADVDDRVLANLFQAGTRGELALKLGVNPPVKQSRDVWHVPLVVAIPTTLTLLPDGDSLTGAYTLFIAAGGDNGAASTVTRIPQTIRIAAKDEAAFRAQTMYYKTVVAIRGGRQIISIGVQDQISHATGFARAAVNAQ